MLRRPPRSPLSSRGQVLPMFAIVIIALFAIVALVVDMGFLFGQKRYDQNGADAAALAAARLLAENVSPLDSTATYFAIPEVEVYNQALAYVAPNQNANLGARNAFVMTLEYWDGNPAHPWCYSPQGPQPPRSPAVPVCTPYTKTVGGVTVSLPPLPASGYPYRVRVTVSSTTDPLFAPAANISGSTQTLVTDPTKPACLKSGTDADRHMVCAHAIAAVQGSSVAAGNGPVLPVTTGDCDIGDNVGGLFQLWGSNPEGCGYGINPWKNMIDLSDHNTWCSDASGGSTPDPDYDYYKLLPTAATTMARSECDTYDTWDRNGFVPDTGMTFTGQTDHDVPMLIARGFQGEIRANYVNGNKVPTYGAAHPAQGSNLGQNVAVGFYCGSSGVGSTWCDPTLNPAGTYYFAQNQPGMQPICGDYYGTQLGLGCRDAVVPTWGDENVSNRGVDWATDLNSGGTGWSHSGGGGPDRVRLVRLLTMRLYCQYAGTGLCTEPPKVVVGSAANSDVWGRFLSPFLVACPPGATCTGSPSINGNMAVLEH
ncbi:MAG: pilus assembly protein TadG-related protein [Chloroflexota bacterium]